jgi:hypothetical protein
LKEPGHLFHWQLSVDCWKLVAETGFQSTTIGFWGYPSGIAVSPRKHFMRVEYSCKPNFLILGYDLAVSHFEQQEFISRIRFLFPHLFVQSSVLEIGSLNLNGSVRTFFDTSNYVGVDLAPGKDVDLVAAGEDLNFPDHSFQVVISTECFEHARYWQKIFLNMARMSSELVVFTCAGLGRPEHGTQRTTPEDSPITSKIDDYYRNLTEDDFQKFHLNKIFEYFYFEFNQDHGDLYFWGLKHGNQTSKLISSESYTELRIGSWQYLELTRQLTTIKNSETWKMMRHYRKLKNLITANGQNTE